MVKNLNRKTNTKVFSIAALNPCKPNLENQKIHISKMFLVNSA